MSGKSARKPRPERGKEWWQDPDAKAFLAEAADRLPKLIGGSKVSISIVPDDVDPKFAVELGYMIMLNKPIIVVVPPGRSVPDKLAQVADRIVQWTDSIGTQHAIIDAMQGLGGVAVDETGETVLDTAFGEDGRCRWCGHQSPTHWPGCARP